MAEYIDLEDAIGLADYTAEKHPYRVQGDPETYRPYNEGWNDACDYISGQLENAKTTLHIRIGRWLHRNGYVECSECGTVGSPQWKCCPICTARMDLEADHGR